MNHLQHDRKLKRISLILLIVFFVVPSVLSFALESSAPLEPTTAMRKTEIEIVRQLKYHHYKKMRINDELSTRFLDRYLLELDEQKLYFSSEDIKSFEQYRDRLDDALEKGDLQPAFFIFNRYRQRIGERLEYLVHMIENDLQTLDFSIEETISLNRSHALWPKDTAELNDLWRKRLKNSVLNLKLDNTPLNEIQALLLKRYRNQLNRIRQTNSMDAFQIYINTIARLYDPHTQYFPPRDYENFDIMMRLSLEGIGAILHTKNEYVEIVRLVPAGPADKAKALKPGDRIMSVAQGEQGNMVDVVGWRLDDVVELIRGPKHSVVRLGILPADAVSANDRKEVSITRDTVKLEEQAAKKEMVDVPHNDRTYHIGILDIPTFYIDFKAYQAGDDDYKSTSRDIRRLINELKEGHVDGIIVDLRDNGGGSLQEAGEVTGMFIPEGPIVQIRNNHNEVSIIYDSDPGIVYDGPLLVLTNRHSASASEIFAGAIQDYHRGIVVGARTFGKGTVQSLQPLYKGQLKLTRAKFYRPSGQSTQHLGVIPDIGFPAIYDVDEIGESALPDALPWDSIDAAKYNVYPDMTADIRLLQQHHLERIKDDPDFEYWIENINRIKTLRGRKQISLNEAGRIQEEQDLNNQRLAIENRRRVRQGLNPFKTIEALKTGENTGGSDSNQADDPFLIESQQILADYIAILENGKAHGSIAVH